MPLERIALCHEEHPSDDKTGLASPLCQPFFFALGGVYQSSHHSYIRIIVKRVQELKNSSVTKTYTNVH